MQSMLVSHPILSDTWMQFSIKYKGHGVAKGRAMMFQLVALHLLQVFNTRSKHITGSKERYLLGQDKTSKFWGNPLCQATKRHLNNS